MKIIYTIKEAEEVLKTLKGCNVEIDECDHNKKEFSTQIKLSDCPEPGTSGQMGTLVPAGGGSWTNKPGGAGGPQYN